MMLRRMRVFPLVVILLLALVGCAGEGQKPTPGVGDADSFMAGLRSAGATVEEGEVVNEPFFSVPGRMLVVNGQKVYAFQYPSDAARQKESSTISPDGFGVGTSMVDWVDQPHFWAQGRLIVLYVGKDQPTIDQISTFMGQPVNQLPG